MYWKLIDVNLPIHAFYNLEKRLSWVYELCNGIRIHKFQFH